MNISPEEHLERLREGKVYIGQQADNAMRNFFSRGNLIALRELAMRKAAERVDEQMGEFRRVHAVRSTWPAAEKLLVCIGPSPMSARLIRATRRLAAGLHARWIAAYVETPSAGAMSEAGRNRLAQNMRLAEQLGGRTVTLAGASIGDEVLAYARAHNITKVVVGKPEQSRWKELFFGSIVDDLVRGSGDIDVYVVRGKAEEPDARSAAPRRPPRWSDYLWAGGVVALATAIGWPLYHSLGLSNTNVLMLYLLGVLWVATRGSRWAAILASVLGVAAFDYCFVPPYLAFAVSDQQYLVTFGVMLITALVISALTTRVRQQAEAARRRERRTEALLALSRDLANTREKDRIIEAAARHVSEVFDSPAAVFLPDAAHHLHVHGGSKLDGVLDEKEMGVVQWVFDHDQPAGIGTGTLRLRADCTCPCSRRAAPSASWG